MDAPLSDYAARVAQIGHLSQEEEMRLARRWRDERDIRARNRLLEAHMGFVLQVARKHYRKGNCLSELVAEGNLGLLYALNKYDPERGFRFVTYAKHWVRVYIVECVLQSRRSVFRDSRLLRKVRRAYREASARLGEGANARQLAARSLGMVDFEFDHLLALSEQRRVSFDLGEHPCFGAGLEQSSFLGPEEAAIEQRDRASTREAVYQALHDLNERERSIVERRLMADLDVELTLLELGQQFGVSRERVRQLEARLKQKLRERLTPQARAAEWSRAPKSADPHAPAS